MNKPDLVVLTPGGRLDAAAVRELEAEWKRHVAAGNVYILVDLQAARHISSSGLRTLLAASRSAGMRGGAVKLCCLSAHLAAIFEMVGLDQVLEIYPNREQAEAAFTAPPDE